MNLQNFIYKYLVCNYFLIFALDGFLTMIGLEQLAKFLSIFLLGLVYITFSELKKKITSIELFIILFYFSIILISIFQNTPFIYLIPEIKSICWSLSFFIIGERITVKRNIQILDKGKKIFIYICVIGLILFFSMPSWYLTFKMRNAPIDAATDYFLEITRLSAFWEFPYWISYGAIIYYLYLSINFYIKKDAKIKNICILFFLFVIILLAQQRSPLLFAIIVTLILLILNLKKSPQNRLYITLTVILMISIIYYISLQIDIELLNRFLMKLDAVNNYSDFLEARANIFGDLPDISFWGDGLGRYSHMAYNMGKQAITDHQYLKILHECGIFGGLGYGIIIIKSITNGIRHYKNNTFELGVILFFLIAMAGANCLSVSQEQSAIFWLCCGRLHNKALIKTKY